MLNTKWIFSSILLIFYACAVMYLLLDVKWTKLPPKRKLWSAMYFLAFCALNISAQIFLGHSLYGKYYLLFTQLPVFVLFLIISSYKGIKVFFVLLTAVFFSSPIMTLISVLRSFTAPPIWAHFACYLIAFLLIKRFFKDDFNYILAYAENSVFVGFTAIPMLYYIYVFSLTKYQFADRVANTQFFIEQIPLFIVLISYILLTQIFKLVSEKAEFKNAQNLVNAQLNAASEQIERLRISEQQSAIYRHDLRHHMRYLNTCIAESRLQEAEEYIQQTCTDVDAASLKRYSDNEAINLILSYYVGKANEKEIAIELHVTATDFSRFHSTDLCSLLSNALENAINASSQAEDSSLRYVKLRLFEKSTRLCMELRNGCATETVFEHSIPVSQKNGHGIGVKSILHVVEKYEGIYQFSRKEDAFILQVSM